MRSDKEERHTKFVSLVEELIAKSPHEFEGFAWAVLSQNEWSDQLGISTKTLRNLAKLPPIVPTKTHIDGKAVVLYRTGEIPHSSLRLVANVMSRLFCNKYGKKRVTRDEYGCLYGLAEVWPDGAQIEIFKSVLTNFVQFRGAVKLAEPDSPYFERYYEFVPIRLIRKFPSLAREVYENELQANGKMPPPAILELNSKKWISPLTGKPFACGGKDEVIAAKWKKVPDTPSPLF